ncbi:MAG: hypothetical protein SA339_11895 [Methanomassiliicoccus sp.]|nr:hypothetical protein [Methanomassiliicoccus sp.]
MPLTDFGRAIQKEARSVTGNRKLRYADILEWSSGAVKVREGEVKYHLPGLDINIVVKGA